MSDYHEKLAAALPDDFDTTPGGPRDKGIQPTIFFYTENQKPSPRLIYDVLATLHSIHGVCLLPVSVERSVSKEASVQIRTVPMDGDAITIDNFINTLRQNDKHKIALRRYGIKSIATSPFG